jgi:DNA polymerase-1
MTQLPAPDDERTLYVVDLSGYVFRAYHAVPALSTSKGVPTNAIYGVVTMLKKLVDRARPRYLAVALDSGGKSHRHALYPAYKATRPPPPPDLAAQVERLRDVIDAYAIPTYAREGVEADDLIASLVARARAAGLRVVVVSADKDLLQLVDDDEVLVWDTMRDQVFGEAETEAKMGVPPQQVRDLLALMGDASDNVPGVPRVGAKTAAALLRQFGDIDGIYARLQEVSKKALRETLETHRSEAMLSRDLVTLVRDVPVDFDLEALRHGGADPRKLRALFEELEFTRLLEGLPPPSAAPAAARHGEPRIRIAADVGEVAEVVAAARSRREPLALFCALDADDTTRASALVGLALCADDGEAVYAPLEHGPPGASAPLGRAALLSALGDALSDPALGKCCADAKRDRLALATQGVTLRGIAHDTMLASYLLDAERHGHSIGEVARAELGVTLPTYDTVTEKQRGSQLSLAQVDLVRVAEWAGRSAAAVRAVSATLAPRLVREGLEGLYRDVELPLSGVLAEMERTGVLLDLERLAALSKQAAEQMVALEQKIVAASGGKPWNPASPRQLETILFDELGLRVIKRTKTARSTDHEVLEELAAEHPLPGLVLEHRALAKLKGTYLDAFPRMVDASGRIHTRYNQAVAATGRLSSSDPNLQNIPIKTDFGREVRKAFVAPPGHRLVVADYSQIELRVLAHLSHDPELVEAFRAGDDVHARTAAALFGVDRAHVTREMRARAKTVNFAVIYGQTEFALARHLRIERKEAARYIEAFFERYAGVRRFFDGVVEEARASGMVHTLLGRRRRIPDLDSANRNLRAAAERVARNTPIQGTAADLLKLAMVRLHRALGDGGLRSRLVLTVHDELVLEVPEAEVPTVRGLVAEVMQGVMTLDVPLVVDVSDGPTWGDAK